MRVKLLLRLPSCALNSVKGRPAIVQSIRINAVDSRGDMPEPLVGIPVLGRATSVFLSEAIKNPYFQTIFSLTSGVYSTAIAMIVSKYAI